MMRRRKLYFFLVYFYTGCSHAPQINEYPPFVGGPSYSLDAISGPIVVARIAGGDFVGKPHASRWLGPERPMQLEEVHVDIETVIQGSSAGLQRQIFFYVDGAVQGHPRLGLLGQGGTWQAGDREMFFLQQDSGVLRTICDTWRSCVIPVFTGSHPDFRPVQDVRESIATILLTRGQNCTDQDMVTAIKKSRVEEFSQEIAIQHLRRLAGTETPPVRQAACEALADLGHPC